MVSKVSDGRERSNEVKAKERTMDLAIGDTLALGLAPGSMFLGPLESPDSGRLPMRLLLKFRLS